MLISLTSGFYLPPGVTEEHPQELLKMLGNQEEAASCLSDRTGVPVSINASASGRPE